MVRYVANVVVDGRTTRFAVILPESAQVSALRDKLKDRLYEFRLGSQEESLVLHLDAVDGPILDPEDLLSDVLPDPKAEELFAVLGKGILGTTAETQNGQATQPAAPREHASSKSFKVRIITPELARSHADVNLIPPISEDKVSSNSSLILLKARVKEHLGLPYSLDPCDDMECNCAFAHQIDQNTALNELGSGASDAMKTLLVVYGNNKVTRVIVEHTTRKSLEDAAREHLRDHISGKIMSTVGGVATRNGPGNEKNYVKLPVIAFCAPISHDDFEKPVRTRTSAYRPQRKLEVDLHTSEAPIEITGSNAQLTLLDAGLDDCTINGVLNIYAVKRLAPSCITDNNVDKGKDAIFRNEDLAWEHPLGQSERGLANLLSTLRVFANNTGAREMEPFQQDKILHLIYVLTRFPPAVRAAHVLMQGKTPTISERAALGQCIYEVLKMIVPLPVIKHDFTRLFEGSRLLFGLIFEKARNLKTSSSEQEGLTYIDSMKVYDLRNMITMEPVGTPVQTVWGLVDQGFQDAFKPEGLLQWTNGTEIIALSSIDQKLQRIALLSGGAKSQVAIFDIDAVNRSPRYAMDINHIIAPSEYSDLQYLATLCSRNKLGVLVPSSLPSAEPPVLTLDRQGHLAVYVGRQSCARPGRDITMFRPANSSAEETVDVSIITQLLVPILDRRNADGTAVFEAFGDQHRRLKDPDEVLILCMDCSSSMDDRCGFIDVEENEDAADPVLENINSSYRWSESMEDRRFDRPALNEMKAYLVEHESFGDMLAIVRSGTYNVNRQDHAEWILKILRILAEKEAEHMAEELENTRRRATSYFYRQKAERMEGELATLKNRSIRLQQYSEALSTFLLYRADNTSAETSEPLTWTVGSEIPKVRKTSSISQDDLDFNVPAEYLCPISAEIMEDPVTTVDNFTYERKNIERWFQTHSTSPCTNLVLTGFDLTPNFAVKRQIEDWTTGSDIISKYQIRRSNQISMTLKSPLSSWTLTLPQDITLLDLYHIAWRQTKGRYQEFELHHRDKMLKPSTEQARSYIKSNQDVFISPYAAVRGQSSTTDEHEELCLVKVYVNQYYLNFISYWEPKKTTKTLASTVFRYYREWFRLESRLPDQESFTLWTNLVHQGDGHYRGIVSNYWESLSYFFDREHARGKLEREPCYESTEEEGSMGTGNGPLVFKIFLGRRPVVDERHKPLTRMDVLKQMFDAYINRLLAYNFQTHIGLVTFRSTASLTQGITHAVENFRYQLNNTTASGDTALWDAIALSRDQLVEYSKKFPNAKLRIICISDGEDTKSTQKAYDVSMQLMEGKIVLDSFSLGEAREDELPTLSYLTGGYKFHPHSMEEAMAICELEPVLSQLERPDIVLPSHATRHLNHLSIRLVSAQPFVRLDEVSRDVYPARKPLPGLSDPFVELGSFSRKFNLANRSDGNLRLARIHSEIRNSGAKIHPHYDVYICEPNFGLWKIVMQGPPGSSYADGTFLLYLEMGDDYPGFAPKARFVTPVYHPNINRHGRICHSILDRNWTVDTTCKEVVDTIYGLLLVPEFSDPINAVVTLNFHWDEVQFKEEVAKHIAMHARKTRAEWKKEILGE